MKIPVAALLCALLLAACGADESVAPGPPPDAFLFDSGGAHHIQGHGAWRVRAWRDGRFQATHDVRGAETVYDEVVLEPSARAVFWSVVDRAGLESPYAADRPGVPDEVRLTFRLERATGETFETRIWQNDLRGSDHLVLQPLLQELRTRIEETYGVKPVF